MRFADLDAVTIDGYGTLLELDDPGPRLRDALARHGHDRDPGTVRNAFLEEARYYRPRSHLAPDAETLAELRLDCVGVFLRAANVDLEPGAFVDDFIGALVFREVPGARETVRRLGEAGLPLAVVANWDCSLVEQLERIDLITPFRLVLTSAAAGVPKPDPAIFTRALAALGADAARALHVGDEDVDRDGAAAAGMRFLPAPLAEAFAQWS